LAPVLGSQLFWVRRQISPYNFHLYSEIFANRENFEFLEIFDQRKSSEKIRSEKNSAKKIEIFK
jgi:hypothetical protein